MQAAEINCNFTIGQIGTKENSLIEIIFKDGSSLCGHFLDSEQDSSLMLQNKWIFYFDEIRLVINGNNIAAFKRFN